MGIYNLWESVETYQYSTTLSEFAQDFQERHGRWPVVAIDMFPFLFEIASGAQTSGQSNFHIQFIRRMRAFLRAGIIPIGVFDGQDKLCKLRHTRKSMPRMTNVTNFMIKALTSMGLQVSRAPAEGEAQCTAIEKLGMADYVFSVDSDCLVFGAQKLIYFEKPNDDHKKSLNSRQIRVTELPDSLDHLAKWRLVLRAVLQGNDFSKGIKGIGELAARACASRDDIVEAFSRWYHDRSDDGQLLHDLIDDELRHNRTEIQQKKWKSKTLNRDQLDRTVVSAFIYPKTATPRLAPVQAYAQCWKQPRYADINALWSGNSPIKVAPKVQAAPADGSAPRKVVQRDTINHILTEIWILWRIMCGTFKPSFTKPLRKAATTTRFETVKLSYNELKHVCANVEENMEIKLPVHLTKGMQRRDPEVKPRVQRKSKEQKISETNHKIDFAKAVRVIEVIDLSSYDSSEKLQYSVPSIPLEMSSSPIIDLTVPEPSSPAASIATGSTEATSGIPESIITASETAASPKMRTVSVTNYFTKRAAPATTDKNAKHNAKRIRS